MSERVAEVVKVYPRVHPNADSLEICDIGGWQCVIRKGEYNRGDLGVFIMPDEIVNTANPIFKFLSEEPKKVRIKAKRLRQQWSEGLLVKAPDFAKEHDNLYEYFQLEHYEPEMEHISTGGNWAKPPTKWGFLSKYDVENGKQQKYANLFVDGETVVITSKLNGSNCSFVYSDGELHCRSRSGFRTRENNVFWNCLTPEIEKFCVDNPDHILYGESIGHVKGWRYNIEPGKVEFAAFDILQPNREYCCSNKFHDFCSEYAIRTVPVIDRTGFSIEKMLGFSEQPCPITGGVQEGVVAKPIVERYDGRLGRVMVKFINPAYLEKN